jgi:hypothetical protein
MQKQKGSILAYSLIILTMMIAVVATMSVTTILEKKSAGDTNFSVQAYQTADSGVQMAIKKINSDLNGTIEDVFSPAECDSGKLQNLNDVSAGTYDLSFYSDEAGTDQITDCDTLANKVLSIKSIGKFHDTVRAVNVAMAAGSSGPAELGTDCRTVTAPKCSGTGSCAAGEYMNGMTTVWDYVNCDGVYVHSYTCCK